MTRPDLPTYPPAVADRQGHTAGLVTRAGAALVDCAVVAAAVAGGYAAVIGIIFMISPTSFRWPQDLAAQLLIPLALGVAVVYLTQSWSGTGRTFGGALLGIRVVTRSGRRLSIGRALARAGLYVLFPAGLLWVAPSRGSRSVQDLLTRTMVIYDWRPQAPRL